MSAERLPCGCVLDVVDDAFVYEPCSPDCPAYRYVVEETRKQGKPVRPIFDPAVSESDQVRWLREMGDAT